MDAIATSRVTKPLTSKHNSSSRHNEALDLHQSSPDIQELSQQSRSEEALELSNKVKMRNKYSSQDPMSTRTTQNDQIQQPGIFGQSKRKPSREERKAIAVKMAEAKRVSKLTLREQSELLQRQKQKSFQHNKETDFKEMITGEDTLNLFNGYYPGGLPSPKPKPYSLSEKLPVQQGEKVTQIRDQCKLLQSYKQAPMQANKGADMKKNIVGEDALNLFNQYYPGGLSNPIPHPYNLSEKPPLALHEIDHSITPGGYRRVRSRSQRKSLPKDVLDSHGQSSQQSRPPENPYHDFEPELIYSHNSGFNPYLENPDQNSNLYYQS